MADLEGEHSYMLTALNAAGARIKVFDANPTEENARSARASIAELSRVIEDHLAHEERDLEPISAKLSGTPQLKSAQKAVRKAHKGNTGTLFAWLLDGADPATRAALRKEVPPPVVFIASQVGGRRYRRNIASVWT